MTTPTKAAEQQLEHSASGQSHPENAAPVVRNQPLHDLGATIFYLRDNRVHSAPVLARMVVENAHDDWASTDEQKKLFTPFGPSRVCYATCHGLIDGAEAKSTKDDLLGEL